MREVSKMGPERQTSRNFQALMNDMNDYATTTTDELERSGRLPPGRPPGPSRLSEVGAGLATFVSIVALAFSGYSFYETSLKQAELRVYAPPLIYMYRQDFRDVFAIPLTISNDGAQRGTVLSFDLQVSHRKTGKTQRFQNLHFGSSPKGDIKLFTPVTVSGGSATTNVVLFHALETGSLVGETTGGVELPLKLTLKMNIDTSGDWFAPKQPAPVTFDMTANYIAGFRDMEAGRPTQLHDARWTSGKAKAL
ncbi:MAG: hypothetical protein R3D44_02940 [Hyphomicrobiaceae bacterium]